ncbi:MAG: SpoIIE family protein phosphatase [Solirubrobacteraceae bacterium]
MTIGSESQLVDALRDAGEVGRDLLAVDWERTPLGAPDAWPPSLQTVVRILLSSRFSMWMAWGSELTFFCNEAYRRDTLATKYPWALGRPAREVWAEIWPEIGPRIDHVLQTGEATWDESLLLFLERSGYEEETYHTFSYSPLAADDGTICGMLCVVSEDTERVIGERRLASLRDLGSVPSTVEDERAFLRAAAAQLGRDARTLPFTAIYTFDEGGGAALAATSGLRAGDPAAPVTIAADDSAQLWPARELAAGAQDQVVIDRLEERFSDLPAGDWERPPAKALAVALPQAKGDRPLGFLVVGANRHRPLDEDYRAFIGLIAQRLAAGVISARSYAAERERAEELAALDRAKTAFFSNVSHEFRTPLTLMLAPLQDAIDAERPLELDQVELVRRNGLRLVKLVNALLDFSRLQAGRLPATFAPVDVGQLTAELAGTFRDACRRAGLALEIESESLPGSVYVDPDLWERVVLNLVSNAFKVTVSGGISVRVGADRDALVLSVADTGPGIAAGERERIFERFHQVRQASSRSHEGAGIGLALVKEIVELHGGQVTAESVVGRGSTFSVRIPLGREHLPAEQVSEQPDMPAPGIADLFAHEALSWLPVATGEPEQRQSVAARVPGGRVLIADDNPDLRSYLTRLLSPFWEVEAVGDGARALEIIRDRRPDLLVSDVMMPGLDGFELLSAVRGSPDTQELPVIMLSARAGEEASIEGLGAGADDYLPKPFSGRELLARVRSHLELSLARRQAAEAVQAQRLLLEQTIRQLPVGVILAEAPSGRIVMANEQVATILGHPLIESRDVSEYSAYQAYLADRRTPAGERSPLARAIRHGETVVEEEMTYRTGDGRWITLRVSAAPIVDPAGEIAAGVVVFRDVTDRVRTGRLLAAQRDIMAMIAATEPLERTLNAIADTAERLSDRGGLASILLLAPDERHLTGGVAPSLPAAYHEAIAGLEPDNLRELAHEHDLRACWSTPIVAASGRLIGTFAMYHRESVDPSPEDGEVVELLSRTAAVAIERSRDAEARARQLSELQTSLLPSELPQIAGLQVAAAFHAGDRSLEVGGDFYDLFELEDDACGLVIGDVCGHGAQAAAVTALTRHCTWSHARLKQDPDRVLEAVSAAVLARGYGLFCTAVYGRLSPIEAGFRFTLAVGGHPPPVIRRSDGTTEFVAEHGPLLGVLPGPTFPVSEFTLEPGDALVLYTDGLIERNQRVSGEDGLAAIVADLADGSVDSMLSELQDAALGPAPHRPRDDVAILILRVPLRA